jgi:hypothetical protein
VASDDFVGVPRDDWRDLTDRVSRTGTVAALLLFCLCFLVLVLVRKGVLSAADLFPMLVPGD